MHNDDMTEMVARIKGFEACELGACKTWDNGRLVTRMIYDGELMIAQIMEEHGGSIAIGSAPGEGTSVTIRLPGVSRSPSFRHRGRGRRPPPRRPS